MLKRFFPLILSSLLLALALPCNAQNKLANPFLPSPANVGQTVAVNVPALPQPISERLACYPLSYARAKDVQEALAPHFGSKLSLDNITNSLILLGDEQCHARLKQLLPKLDIPTRQVTLEAKIIAVSREDSKNLGVRWDWDTIPQSKQETNDSNSDSSNYDGSFKFWRSPAPRPLSPAYRGIETPRSECIVRLLHIAPTEVPPSSPSEVSESHLATPLRMSRRNHQAS